ncbi:MAG: efflux RND transporter periplasmic adaptor subunit [Muribaculaceae bacterium]|nr:efflux RND transporter periplasmic adaptor subunit [Muribaculaceae bacterium]
MRTSIVFYSCLLFFSGSCVSNNEADHEEHEEHHDHAGVTFEPDKAKEFGVEFEIIAPGTFHDVIKTSGTIQPSSSDIQTITAKKSGIVTLNSGISEGAYVTSGQNIGRISAEGIQGGDVNQAAQANLNAAKAEYERLKPLHEEGLVTTSAFREAERAYKEAQALAGKINSTGASAFSSNVTGNIQNLYVKTGEYVEVGSPIATIVKNSNLILKADLPARESKHIGELESANFIPEGGEGLVKLSELNGKKVTGNVTTATNGYIPVYFSFTGNPVSYPGGYVEVYLICGERKGVISVPREALVEIQGNKYVYVAEDDHDYEKRLVKTGASDGERIEITEGLNEGDKIVAKGASIIRMAEVSSIAPPAHTHNH